jgi:hypothetical protein
MAKRGLRRSYKGYTIHVNQEPGRSEWAWFVTATLEGGRTARLEGGYTRSAREADQAGRRCIESQVRRYH